MNIGDKDIYEYMLNFADDRTILNMLSVNRQFRDEVFFEKVMKRKYPLLIDFQKEGESYKQLFLRMVKTLSFLWENYQIPYIPTKDCNPEKLSGSNIYNMALICAAAGNNVDTVQYLIEQKGADDFFNSFIWAAGKGSIDVMKYLFKKKEERKGDIDPKIFNLELNFRLAFVEAIKHGQLESIKFLIDKGAYATFDDVEHAKMRGKYKIAEYLSRFVK